ncbi:ROK family transcriptional regulator [Mesorhizobium sp.]|uniref:ROK family transcriptional regulator n=1 Tax=Mesorhizobium sp. TaxID=1871066 RepID=UPI0025F6E873|nr:ROK family transcriptional regulator [Mesorhizobium sp.]
MSVRSYNERLVLSLLLQNEGISRMEIGERTGLSAQTASVIVRSLEQEGLVSQGEAQRGRVGPPTKPLSLNPNGAYAVGVGFSRRKIDIALIDFIGTVRFHKQLPAEETNPFPQNGDLLEAIKKAMVSLPAEARSRIAGVGLAVPDEVDALAATRNGSSNSLKALQAEIEEQAKLPVFVQNDITAAAGGESMFGVAKPLDDYLFFYLGARLQSRLILNHQIYKGNSSASFDHGLLRLENELTVRGRPCELIWDSNTEWPDLGEAYTEWLSECSNRLKASISALTQFVEFKTVVLSSYAPQKIAKALCADISREFANIEALPARVTISPKAVGAASLPFSSRFMIQ